MVELRVDGNESVVSCCTDIEQTFVPSICKNFMQVSIHIELAIYGNCRYGYQDSIIDKSLTFYPTFYPTFSSSPPQSIYTCV